MSKPAKQPSSAPAPHSARPDGISDTATLRARARKDIDDGAITPTYSADREAVIKLLNDALATEYVCVLRYYRHYFMAKGMLADAVKAEFLEHAQQEQAHAGKLAERIVQLGGEPDLNPDTLTARSHAEYKEGKDLRDKLDTLVGIFGIGMLPTGSKDPFALRRQALGVLRILIEKGLELDLPAAVAFAIAGYGERVKAAGLQEQVLDFVFDRLRARYEDEGVDTAAYLAVRALRPASALDFDQRVQAVQAFRRLPEAEALAAANKRVSNLLGKFEGQVAAKADAALFETEAERTLAAAIAEAERDAAPLAEARRYGAALERLASLRAPVDAFFDEVLVNAEDERVRANRYALLAHLRGLFLGIADISVLG